MERKYAKRLLTLAMAMLMVASMAVPAFASNQDVRINRFTVTDVTQYVVPQKKENDTSCYVRMDDLNTYRSVMVNVYGQTSGATHFATKYECNNGVDDRIIQVGQGYLVSNQVYERGYGYATLGLSRAITQNYEISGWWSPDSVWESGLISI